MLPFWKGLWLGVGAWVQGAGGPQQQIRGKDVLLARKGQGERLPARSSTPQAAPLPPSFLPIKVPPVFLPACEL